MNKWPAGNFEGDLWHILSYSGGPVLLTDAPFNTGDPASAEKHITGQVLV